MKLHDLQPADGATKKAKRKGRGPGSGNGKTAGKGHKGQLARSGGKGPYFEGGQLPMARRIPKRGFNNIFAKDIAIISLSDLEKFDNGSLVDEAILREIGLVKGRHDGIKVLGNGDITKKLTVRLSAFSSSARQKIEEAGGKAEVV